MGTVTRNTFSNSNLLYFILLKSFTGINPAIYQRCRFQFLQNDLVLFKKLSVNRYNLSHRAIPVSVDIISGSPEQKPHSHRPRVHGQASDYSHSLQHRGLSPQRRLRGKSCVSVKKGRGTLTPSGGQANWVSCFKSKRRAQGTLSPAACPRKAQRSALLRGRQNPWRSSAARGQVLLKSAFSSEWRVSPRLRRSHNDKDNR